MGLRFRRSLKIAPGVRINLGKRGVSSIGVSGFSFGKRGVYHNIGIPGTGVSYRSRLVERRSSKPVSTARANSAATVVPISLCLREDGSTMFLDKGGKPLSDEIVRVAKKQNKELILEWLEEQCAKYNSARQSLLDIYLPTPAPQGEVIVNSKPEPPRLGTHGLLSSLSDGHRQKVDERNRQAQQGYEKALVDWERAEHSLRTNTEMMSAVLSNALASIEWPRETLASFEITEDGRVCFLDVDLPEIEDMPTQEAGVSKQDYRLVIKGRSQSQMQLDYLTFIHAIGFRLVGDVFAHLPSVSMVVFSGYSQRINKKTGSNEDEYLYSVRVSRGAWEQIAFSNLESIDVVACFERFELRRNVTKRGVISPIEPFGTPAAKMVEDKQSLCPKCGSPNPTDYKFCETCGVPLTPPEDRI